MNILLPDSGHVIAVVEWSILLYFIGLNLGYLTLSTMSFLSIRSYMPNRTLDVLPQIYSGHELPVSILVPAYNEEATIVATVRSMLQLDYPQIEIIVINDDSKDRTLDVLRESFGFELFPEAYRQTLPTADVRGIYHSTRHDNLRLIDKANGGKADSLNAGINTARYPLFCVVDADCILERESINRIVQPFVEDQRVVAVGGTIRVANGCNVKNGFLTKVDLPRNLLARVQVVEYLRAFLFGRLGWSALGAILIISGAFGVFRKDTVVGVGGFRKNTIGEDMELVVRMHRLLRAQRKPYKMVFLPDPVAWTEVPEDWRTFKNQRARWQRGLAESLFNNMGLLFSRHGGTPGWLAFPFMLFFEVFGPVFEVMGYLLMCYLAWTSHISWPAFWVFLFATVGIGLLLSLACLLLEEMTFHIYNRPRQFAWLLAMCVLENFGYRQVNSFLRMLGLYQWATNRKAQWGQMKRTADWQSSR